MRSRTGGHRLRPIAISAGEDGVAGARVWEEQAGVAEPHHSSARCEDYTPDKNRNALTASPFGSRAVIPAASTESDGAIMTLLASF